MTIKVMIVDDSMFVRVVLQDILENQKETDIEVVHSVSNGKEAIELLKKGIDVDVITLDVRMPDLDGIETLKELMKIKEVPVVMISSYTKKGSDKTIEALMLGAIDFITKPSDTDVNDLYELSEEIITKVIIASEAKNSTYIFNQNFGKTNEKFNHIIAIGASTGGPSALKKLLSDIPKTLNAPIVIAQHIPIGNFANSLADNLNQHSPYKVKLAENGEKIVPRTVYICPGGNNIEIFKRGEFYHLVLNNKTYEKYYKPSVDLLFSSLARMKELKNKTGIILTGMGDDGLNGSIALEREGGLIIAESSRTSIVYGMPKKIAEYPFNKKISDVDKIFRLIRN